MKCKYCGEITVLEKNKDVIYFEDMRNLCKTFMENDND